MRKTMQELRLDVLRVVEDPSTSGVNEGRLFDYLQDLQDTLTPAYCGMVVETSKTFALTLVDSLITWESLYVEQKPEFSGNHTTGEIRRDEGPCMTRVSFNVDAELATNREVEFTLYADNVATLWRAKCSGSGSGRPAVAAFEALWFSATPVIFTIKALVDTATSVILTNGVFLAAVVPVREG